MPFLNVTSACVLSLLFSVVHAADWPQYRNAGTDGRSLETDWQFSGEASPPLLWKAKIGRGFGAVSVHQGLAVAAGHQKGRDTVYGFDAESGEVRWTHSYAAPVFDHMHEGGPAGSMRSLLCW